MIRLSVKKDNLGLVSIHGYKKMCPRKCEGVDELQGTFIMPFDEFIRIAASECYTFWE